MTPSHHAHAVVVKADRRLIVAVVSALTIAVGGSGTSFALNAYRIDKLEEREEKRDAKVDAITDKLSAIQQGVARIEGQLTRTRN
jgi:hypothetical protein